MGNRHSLVAFLLVFVSLGLSSCGHKVTREDAESYLASAKNYESSGQFRAAIIEIRKAIQVAPDDPRGTLELARVFNDLGQSTQAIDLLKDIKDNSPDYVITLARAYIDAGKTRSASDFLDKHEAALKDRPSALGELRGDLALATGDFDTAMKQYQSVAARDTSNVKARLGVARVEAAEGHFDKAKAVLDSVLKSHPDDPRTLLYLSVIRTREGDIHGAEELLTRAAAASPTGDLITPLRYSILASLRDNLTRQGRTDDALVYSRLLAEATQDSKQIDEKVRQAVDAASDSDFEKARKLLTEIQAQVPNSARAGTMLGVVDYLQGDNRAAARQFEKFVDPEIASPQALQMYAMAELKLNRPDTIIEHLKKDIDDKKDGRVVALYGIALVSAGDQEAGEKYLKRAIELTPDNPRLRLPLVRLLNNQGRSDSALAQLRAAYKTKPGDPLVEAALVEQLSSMGRTEDAAGVVLDLQKSYPDAEQTQLVVANFYMRQHQLDKARDLLQGLGTLDKSPQALHLLARIELQMGNYHLAAQRFRQLIALHDNDRLAYKGLITAFELQKEPARGVDEVEQMAKSAASDAPTLVLSEYFGRKGDFDRAFSLLGQVKHPDAVAAKQLKRELVIASARKQLGQGDFDASRQTIVSGLSEFPDNPQLLATLIDVELAAGKPDEAEKVLSRLRKAAPDAPVVDVLAGDLAVKQNDLETARRDYESAWKRVPTDLVALKIYAVLRKTPGIKPAELRAFFDEWDRRVPGGVASHIARAGNAMATGDMALARTEYETLLKAHPDTPIALNNLAWIYGEAEIHKALAASKRAYELAPKSGEIADTYGWFLYKSGDAAKARQVLAEATRLAPQNAEIRKHFDQVSGTAK